MLQKRYPELDALRGLAVLLMVAYHLFFDLSYYYSFSMPSYEMHEASRLIASLFLIIIGVCFVISWERTAPRDRWKKYLRRAGIVFGGAMIISLVTYLHDPDSFIVFGILHLIAVSAMLQPFFRPLRRWNMFLGAIVFSTIIWLPAHGSSLLIPFGFVPEIFISLDYYPLLPWFGMILLGMGLGDLLYIPSLSPMLRSVSSLPYPRWLLWTGRRALFIYFVHQPIILLLLWMGVGR